MKLQKNQILIIGAVLFLIILFVLIFAFGKRSSVPPKVKLVVWGLEPEANFKILIEAYKSIRSNVTVDYVQLDMQNYRKQLLDALSSGQGPDIFMIQNKHLLDDINKIYAAPNTQFNLNQLRNLFPQVVEDDFVYQNNIYALPLYIDTLALFYNQDYFNKAGLVNPPKNWEEFAEYSNKLKTIDINSGEITQAGAAMGEDSQNIFYAPDILKLLFKQYGVKIFDEYGRANLGLNSNGPAVLSFYTSFANNSTENYSWPRNFSNSFDEFTSGKAAMIFAYQKDINSIKNKNPFLNFRIAVTPQTKDAKINYSYADYWGLVVSKQSQNQTWAWDFIINTAANSSVMQNYIAASGRPPALKSLISQKLNDPELSVFVSQALIARSWQEINSEQINKILDDVISGVNSGRFNFENGIRYGEEQINQLLRNN